ncbi:MAG: putative metallopeptidase [Azonexus sp.]
MSKTEYVTDANLDKVVKDIIEKSTHPALKQLREQELTITPIMKVRTNKDGEHEPNPGPPAKIQKVSDLWRLFTEAHYLLIVDHYFFNHCNCVEAGIFNALCEVEVTAKEGAIKLAVKKPDLNLFVATLQVYGAYDDQLLGLREWMNTAKTKAAKSFAEKVSTGKLGPEGEPEGEPKGEPNSTENADEDPPRIHAGVPDENEAPRGRGGRNRR